MCIICTNMSNKDYKRIVVKVGTSTLTYETGKTNIRQMKKLVAVLSDIVNSGIEVALVSSGSIGVGAGKIGMKNRPKDTTSKQALSTIGQCELMFMYDKMFSEYGHSVGQVLVTKRNVEAEETRKNLINTFEKLFEYGVVPIINENDAIAIEEIVFGDNDTLSANVAKLVKADALMILTDTDGLYDKDPNENEDAKVIPVVDEITESLFEVAGGRGSKFGTGGMITKLEAAQIATEAGIDTFVSNGDKPENLYKILEGKEAGTLFKKKD